MFTVNTVLNIMFVKSMYMCVISPQFVCTAQGDRVKHKEFNSC